MSHPVIRAFFILFFLCFSGACVRDVDFDQVSEFRMNPVVESSLVYSYIPVPVWDSIPVHFVISDTTAIEIFSNSFSVDKLEEAVLHFEILSTATQALSVGILLTDDNYTMLGESVLSLPVSSGEEQQAATELVYSEAELEVLKQVTRMIFTLTIPGFGNTNEEAYVKLRSKGTFYLHIE